MNYQLIIVIVFLVILYINKKNLTNIYIKEIKKYHSPYKIVTLIVFMHLITFSQSIFSIIRKMNNPILLTDETYFNPFGTPVSLKYPFWATRKRY